MSPLLRSLLTVAAAAVIVAALVAGPGLLRSRDEAPPSPTPRPGISAKAGEMRTVPDVSAERRKLVTKDVAKALRRFYTRAFVQPAATPGPGASPRRRPTQRVRTLMTAQARSAIKEDPGPFDQLDDFAVYTGTVTFSGLLTFDGRQPLEAFLDIDFGGVATPVGLSSPQVKVRQLGTILLKNTSDGWLVDGFDVRLATRPLATPTPSPS